MGSITILPTSIFGLHTITPSIFDDNRGTFTKVFNTTELEKKKLQHTFKESYYSTSKKGVIRGMHFQLPPHDHAKLVYVPFGKINDCVLDIRKNSPTYGKHLFFELSHANGVALYISPGLAHGFEALDDGSVVAYLQTSLHNPEADSGIKFNSFGARWNTLDPIVSDRDEGFSNFDEYISTFEYQK
jgi:dTDP-4-dehydrorhamnose 3,5-epimerase